MSGHEYPQHMFYQKKKKMKNMYIPPDKRGIHIICFLFPLREALLMSTHNICFHGEIRKISYFLAEKNALSGAMCLLGCSLCQELCVAYYAPTLKKLSWHTAFILFVCSFICSFVIFYL